jgi:hypothetical protein
VALGQQAERIARMAATGRGQAGPDSFETIRERAKRMHVTRHAAPGLAASRRAARRAADLHLRGTVADVGNTGVPLAMPFQPCPKCKTLRSFVNVDGGLTYRCAGCEWFWSLTAGSPAGTATAPLAQGGTAVTVASGGAAFTSGMRVLYDSGTSAEVLNVDPGATGTSVPVSAAVKAHLTAATFGKLVLAPTLGGVGQQAVPQLPGISGVN